MKRFDRILTTIFLLLTVAAGAPDWLRAEEVAVEHVVEPWTVVLISLDGTRPADITPEQLTSLVLLGEQGARASALIPIDPANTFPSHVSIVTGVRPEEHRLVNNLFDDPELGRFTRKEPHIWIESEPIWSIAERHGIPTASYYWVGSEGPWKNGPGSRYFKKFSARTKERAKVNQILEWLSDPDSSERPRLITSWFHGADHPGHVSGPGTKSVARYLKPQDEQIARLVREMELRGLFETTTLIFVSDHGMVKATKRVNLGKRLKQAGLKVSLLGIGGFAIGFFKSGKNSDENLSRAVDVARDAGLEAWPTSEAPKNWHVHDTRYGDFVVRAPIGTAIVRATSKITGFHGYLGTEPEMAGILVARGRGVEVGAQLGKVSSLAIAPTILRLLGLPIPPQMKQAPIPELLQGIEAASTALGEGKPS